jgi:AcrR family transcriptional regulator
MAHSAQLREKAKQLRTEQSMALDDIASQLGIAKSTAYYWLKDIEIPKTPSQKQTANQHRAAMANQVKYAAQRQSAYDATRAKATEILTDQRIRDFVVLYLAEEFRKDRNRVCFSNSNPQMSSFAHSCMKRLATNPRCYYSFQYHADQDPEDLRRFWAAQLGIQPTIIKPIPKTNSGHLKGRRFNCQYGVFQIQIGDTRFRSQLQALMDAVQEQWNASVHRP